MMSPQRTFAARIFVLFLAIVGAVVSSGCVKARKPAIVSAAEWGSKPLPIPQARRQTPTWITLHHAGVLWEGGREPADFVRNMQSWGQRDKNWPDLPYHFLIAPDGRIFEGRPIEFEPESNTRYELSGNIGVEMMGNFEQQRPSEAQLESAAELVAWLCQEHRIDPARIRGHRDAAPGQTSCPGRDFNRYLDSGEFREWVVRRMRGERKKIDQGPALPGGPTTRIAL